MKLFKKKETREVEVVDLGGRFDRLERILSDNKLFSARIVSACDCFSYTIMLSVVTADWENKTPLEWVSDWEIISQTLDNKNNIKVKVRQKDIGEKTFIFSKTGVVEV